MSALAVVVPTLGRRAALDECLARLAGVEVLLVADAAVEDVEALERRFAASRARGRVLQAALPGASAARNAGWEASAADAVLFLDDDVWAGPGLVEAHRGLHEAERAAGVGGLGTLRWADGLRVTPFMRWLEGGVAFDFGALDGVPEVGWTHLYSCNCSLKHEALEAVGGFDAAGFPFGYEDTDLGLRLDGALPGGLRLRVLAAAQAEHHHAMELAEWEVRVGRIARAERRFVARHPGVEPWFHRGFAAAATEAPRRGRAARVAPYVPRDVPVLGPRVAAAAGAWWRQRLAVPFLAAWETADGEPGPPPRGAADGEPGPPPRGAA